MAAKPWYAGEHKDALLYLLIAIFFLELVVGGISFFYGIINAKPVESGGPPVADFPWVAWCAAAILAPVALLLIVHLAGSWVSRAMEQDEVAEVDEAGETENRGASNVPDGVNRFYASVRRAPAVVLLAATLFCGGALFFVDGAFAALGRLAMALVPYAPWLVASLGVLLAVCFIGHALMVYKQRKMENEYAWRREVLEKTGLVLMDKKSVALPMNNDQKTSGKTLPPGAIVDVTARQLPAKNGEEK